MTRLAMPELVRMIKVCGVAKHAFAVEGNGPTEFDESIARFTSLDRVRLGYFRRHIGLADPKLVPIARGDLCVIEGDRRRAHARLGLLTFGRLLDSVEPHRARWALQHVPYPIARMMRPKVFDAALSEGATGLGIVGDGGRLGPLVRRRAAVGGRDETTGYDVEGSP